jgi:hypothetical protein
MQHRSTGEVPAAAMAHTPPSPLISVTAASSELRISQPAILKHIAELERGLGLKLVKRARRDGALTNAGDFVANHVLRAESCPYSKL